MRPFAVSPKAVLVLVLTIAALAVWPLSAAWAEPLAADAASALSRYIVTTDPGSSTAGVNSRAVAASSGIEVTNVYSQVMTGFAGVMTAAQAASLQAQPGIVSVVPDVPSAAESVEPSPPWGLDRIDHRAATAADDAYSYDTTGKGVTVFVIDTGIRLTHQEFGGRAVSGYDFVDDDTDASDCYGHGTHVAGTIGGSTYGVAKDVNYVALRIFDCAGAGWNSDLIAALDWVVAHKPAGPSVVNFSGSSLADSTADAAVERTVAAGIPVVVAASNDSADACTRSPARTPNAITVGATDSTDTRAYFSNYGSCVDLFAPGVSILSSLNDSDTASAAWDGTSMATPHVSGIVARYLQAHPTATPAQTTAAVLAAATPDVVTDPLGSPNLLAYAAPDTSSPAAPLPAAPTSVAATKNDAARTATLTWAPPAGAVEVTGYRVARDGVDDKGTGAWSTTVATTARSYTFSSLKAGSTYHLTVQAITAVGAGATASGTVTIFGLPGIPTSVAATKSDGARTATLRWAPPTSTGGSAITGYRVTRDGSDDKGTGAWSTTVAATARSYTFGSLRAGDTYHLTVQAISAAGAGSAASGAVTIASLAGAPVGVTGTKNVSARTATVKWAPPAATGGAAVTGYRVARDGVDANGIGAWSTTTAAGTRSYTFTGLKTGNSYHLTVQALTAAGAGATATVRVTIS